MITYGFWVPNFRCCKWERSTAIFLQLCWWYCHLKLLDGLYRVATFLLYRKVLTHVRLKRLTELSCIWYCCTWEANVTVRELAWCDHVSWNEFKGVKHRFGQLLDDQSEIEEGHRVMNYDYLIYLFYLFYFILFYLPH